MVEGVRFAFAVISQSLDGDSALAPLMPSLTVKDGMPSLTVKDGRKVIWNTSSSSSNGAGSRQFRVNPQAPLTRRCVL